MAVTPSDGQVPGSELPFVAPCRQLSVRSPFLWLRRAWSDIRAAPLASLTYGVALTLVSAGVVLVTWKFGTLALYLGLATAFVFVGPLLAMGLYSISREIEAHDRPNLRSSWKEGRSHLGEMLVLGIALLVVLLLWGRAATIMNVFRPSAAVSGIGDLVAYLGIGTLVGAFFCAIVFATVAFSLPMLVDCKADAITAGVTSINATLRNKAAMLVWASLIGATFLLGFATGLLGFVILMPLIGHATWHGYRETIDASAWPKHP